MRYLIEIRDGDFWHSSGLVFDDPKKAEVEASKYRQRGFVRITPIPQA